MLPSLYNHSFTMFKRRFITVTIRFIILLYWNLMEEALFSKTSECSWVSTIVFACFVPDVHPNVFYYNRISETPFRLGGLCVQCPDQLLITRYTWIVGCIVQISCYCLKPIWIENNNCPYFLTILLPYIALKFS